MKMLPDEDVARLDKRERKSEWGTSTRPDKQEEKSASGTNLDLKSSGLAEHESDGQSRQ